MLYTWAYIVPVIYILFNLKYLKKIISIIVYSESYLSVFCFVIIGILSIFVPVLYGTNDFTYFTDSVLTFIKILLRMLFLVILITKNIPKATAETFMKYFIFSCCVYICGTAFMIIFPGTKSIFINMIKETEHAKMMAMDPMYKTRYGWAGFSGFEYTFKCVLAIIFNNFLIKKTMKKEKIWMRIAVSVFLLMGTLFYGRIGSLVGMLVMLVLFLQLLKRRPKVFVIVIAGSCVICIILFILQMRSEAIQTWFRWAFDLFVTFVETGKLQTGSSNVLLEKMLFVPDVETILLGDGYYTTAKGYYMSTDAGIMRSLLFGGVVMAFLRYISLYGALIYNVIKKNDEKRFMYIWIFIVCIIFEIKGEIIFSCLPIVIWIFVLSRYEIRRKSKWSEN